MERIRSKSDSLKSLADSSKIVRMGMADRRHSLDTNDKAVLRSCLDTLQASISVRSVSGMSERLETTARQMGLKFMVHSTNPNTHNFYISTETFYVEICIDQNGSVLETRIHHQNIQGSISSTPSIVTAPEISECLSKGDFTMFVEHLKGLMSVYDLPDCGNVEKSRAWQALYNLEHDLTLLASGQSWVTDINQLIHKTGLGMVHNRAGGIPMKLRFFLPPYELLDLEQKTILPMNQSTITEKNLGFCATITLKPSRDPFLLPLSSLISSTGQDLPITQTNAIPLPAHFTLALDKPLPLSHALIRHLVSVTSIDWLDSKNNSPLLKLITMQASNGTLDPSNNRGLFVTLPDQQHCYFMTETNELVGQSVDHIPFRHPNQVPSIVDILRRQALFNTLISSCVRTNSLEDVDTSVMFEVTCLDPMCQTMSITFEHPVEETMATAELTLSDLTAPRCRVYTGSLSVCPEETANKVLQRCLSIPVTMRAVINKGKGDVKQNLNNDSDITIGGHQNGVGHHSNMDTDHKSMSGSGVSGGRFKMENGRGGMVGTMGTPAVCDPGGGGPGGGKVKQEPMETEHTNDTDSLNRYGPQAVDSLPGAPSTLPKSPRKATVTQAMDNSHQEATFRHPSQAVERPPKCEVRRKSDSSKSEYEVNQLLVSVSRGPLSENHNKVKKENSMKSPSKEGKPIQPNVSITPICDKNVSDESNRRNVSTTGIEIIPLGGKPITTGSMSIAEVKLKAKARDLKRSLSEDDKRRLHKKEKRRREDKQRQSLSSPRTENSLSDSHKYKAEHQKQRGKEDTHGTKLPLKSPKTKLAGVIERLAFQTSDSAALEIKPSTNVKEKSCIEPNVEITIDKLKTRPNDKTEDILKPKLKLTIKTSNKLTENFPKDKYSDSGVKLFDSLVSPRLDKTFQIPKLNKQDALTPKKEKTFSAKSPSTSPKHSPSKTLNVKSAHTKITERFITDPAAMNSRRSEERKRSSERERDSLHFKTKHDGVDSLKVNCPQASVSMHIVKSPAPAIVVQSPISSGLGHQLSPLSDSLLDEGLLMKWMIWLATELFQFSAKSTTSYPAF